MSYIITLGILGLSIWRADGCIGGGWATWA